jgi:hypothetical protein
MNARSFQTRAVKLLKTTFGKESVVREYNIGAGAEGIFADNKRYLPRLDIAVGPFNKTRAA